jgi:hypothetical protein
MQRISRPGWWVPAGDVKRRFPHDDTKRKKVFRFFSSEKKTFPMRSRRGGVQVGRWRVLPTCWSNDLR